MNQISLIVFLLFLVSCDSFLDADLNKSQITTRDVFSSDVTATAAVTAIYNTISSNSPLSGTPSGMNALAGLSAGELYNYPQNADLKSFQLHNINPQNSNIASLWNCMYNIIYQSNAVLEGVAQSSSLSNETAQQLKGEALFMRAFVYFYLVNLFGDVPLVTEADYSKNQSLFRRSINDVCALIESDLLSAQSLLSEKYVTENRVRPNRATATALLARLYLYRQEYSKSEVQASSIIEDATYALTSKADIDKTFLIKSTETIWQLMPVIPYTNTIEGSYFIITTVPHYNVITNALVAHFEVGDLRAKYWISSDTTEAGIFFFPYKYKQSTKEPSASFTECSVVFRLAEIYLLRAEARAFLDNLSAAQSDLNVVRARAGLSEVVVSNKQDLFLAIESERWSELFTEYGHRWLDLKRTGRAVDVLSDNDNAGINLLYPVPAAEFIRNSNLGKQNDGY